MEQQKAIKSFIASCVERNINPAVVASEVNGMMRSLARENATGRAGAYNITLTSVQLDMLAMAFVIGTKPILKEMSDFALGL